MYSKSLHMLKRQQPVEEVDQTLTFFEEGVRVGWPIHPVVKVDTQAPVRPNQLNVDPPLCWPAGAGGLSSTEILLEVLRWFITLHWVEVLTRSLYLPPPSLRIHTMITVLSEYFRTRQGRVKRNGTSTVPCGAPVLLRMLPSWIWIWAP